MRGADDDETDEMQRSSTVEGGVTGVRARLCSPTAMVSELQNSLQFVMKGKAPCLYYLADENITI
jgi:hypothetical protein